MTWVAGHFGEWMQGRLGQGGPLVLVTVPCRAFGAKADVANAASTQSSVTLKKDLANRFLGALAAEPVLQDVPIQTDAPFGGGAGMSTASLLSVASSTGISWSPKDLASACLRAEGAVDPLMYQGADRLLWAPREARIVEDIGALPAFDIVGGFWGKPEYTDPADTDFPDIADLITLWKAAVAREDRAAIAGLATEAFRRTTSHRGPEADPTLTLAADLGALGVIRAHTGSARGFLFAPGAAPTDALAKLAKTGYSDAVVFQTGGP